MAAERRAMAREIADQVAADLHRLYGGRGLGNPLVRISVIAVESNERLQTVFIGDGDTSPSAPVPVRRLRVVGGDR